MLEAALQDPLIAGLILISAPPVKNLEALDSRPVLLIASQGEQHGLILEQAQASAKGVTNANVIVLPGEGSGTFIFSSVWSQVRKALVDFVQAAK
jgi:hypothetical protein